MQCDCPGDISGGGVVDAFDLNMVLAAWCSVATLAALASEAEADNDATVGILDLLTLLANWGPCA